MDYGIIKNLNWFEIIQVLSPVWISGGLGLYAMYLIFYKGDKNESRKNRNKR